ncbi:putative Chaperone J-domain superfamily [Helianthus annuus]|nr:putative Chaperone J-domain superfamily [Helianthus annuus]
MFLLHIALLWLSYGIKKSHQINHASAKPGCDTGTARRRDDESVLTRAVDSVFRFVRFAEFEILFILFFIIAFIIFKDLLYDKRCNGFVVFAAANNYSTLGVPKSATNKDIKAAYRKFGHQVLLLLGLLLYSFEVLFLGIH